MRVDVDLGVSRVKGVHHAVIWALIWASDRPVRVVRVGRPYARDLEGLSISGIGEMTGISRPTVRKVIAAMFKERLLDEKGWPVGKLPRASARTDAEASGATLPDGTIPKGTIDDPVTPITQIQVNPPISESSPDEQPDSENLEHSFPPPGKKIGPEGASEDAPAPPEDPPEAPGQSAGTGTVHADLTTIKPTAVGSDLILSGSDLDQDKNSLEPSALPQKSSTSSEALFEILDSEKHQEKTSKSSSPSVGSPKNQGIDGREVIRTWLNVFGDFFRRPYYPTFKDKGVSKAIAAEYGSDVDALARDMRAYIEWATHPSTWYARSEKSKGIPFVPQMSALLSTRNDVRAFVEDSSVTWD